MSALSMSTYSYVHTVCLPTALSTQYVYLQLCPHSMSTYSSVHTVCLPTAMRLTVQLHERDPRKNPKKKPHMKLCPAHIRGARAGYTLETALDLFSAGSPALTLRRPAA